MSQFPDFSLKVQSHSGSGAEKKPAPAMETPSVEDIFPYFEMLRILNFYLDLEWWIISPEASDRWMEIRRHRRAAWPLDYDFLYGRREERVRYNEEQIRRMIREKRPFCSGLGDDLWALYVPVLKDGKLVGILQTGVFLRKIPDRQSLLRRWRELTGSEALEFDPDFLNYARTILGCPLVEEPVYKALLEITELYAGLMAGNVDSRAVRRRTEELKLTVLVQNLWHQSWLEDLVKKNRCYPPTWRVGKLTPWEREEMGLERIPTAILAVRFDEEGEWPGDELDLMLRHVQFQREMFRFSRTLPGLSAFPLDDYGMLFFTSFPPGRKEARTKLEILDKLDAVSRFVQGRFNSGIWAGISWTGREWVNPAQCYREALTALGSCRSLKRPIVFYEDLRSNPQPPEPVNFIQIGKALIEAHAQGAARGIERIREEYIGKIQARSIGRPENTRLHFLYALGQIVERLSKHSPLWSEELSFLFRTFEGHLQEAGTIRELSVVFRESLKQLMGLALRPSDASQTIRMEGARKYIDENFIQDLKLETVALRNGFSVSLFGKGFKKTMGMGFSAYLRKRRLAEAKRLLASTRLSVAQVSQQCGFTNLQYFFDVFKRSTGYTPLEFRRNARITI